MDESVLMAISSEFKRIKEKVDIGVNRVNQAVPNAVPLAASEACPDGF
jgi:hypothetical protein